jgi:hypothetical protein
VIRLGIVGAAGALLAYAYWAWREDPFLKRVAYYEWGDPDPLGLDK